MIKEMKDLLKMYDKRDIVATYYYDNDYDEFAVEIWIEIVEENRLKNHNVVTGEGRTVEEAEQHVFQQDVYNRIPDPEVLTTHDLTSLKQENKRDKLVKEVIIALKEKYSYENRRFYGEF